MKTTNPALTNKILTQVTRPGEVYRGEPMTIEGTVNRAAFLLFLVVLPAAWIWSGVLRTQTLDTAGPWMVGGIVGGLIAAVVTIVKKDWAGVTAPIYAACEGLAIGGISAMAEMQYHGIVIQAVGLTFGTMLCMLVAYRSGLIRVTDKFRLGVVAATGAIALLYLATFVLSLFHVSVPFVFGGGTAGIVISLVIVGVAALNLVLDFDFIEQAATAGAPKYVEWYAAFGLMVTLIWLYLELLRLLGNLRRR
jgi:uncharacterized YccA/Bax inhibitor family protein